jgi:hypothetical protein
LDKPTTWTDGWAFRPGQVYEAILENGPLDTVRLRQEARRSADSAKSRFDRALVELQVGLKVLPIGMAHTGA